ncbi:SET domain-containing protein [Durusdinium trenchii]|uniref:SET domain-containing protein n=1 Tax=Durusdinium trenchii TaxID=1381693 RepID=A0ABP0IYZ9_9DINO
MRASVRTLARDDYLAVRLKRLAAWARSCSVAELPAQESGEWNGHGLARTLLPLCQSRFFGAAELQALVATGRGQCRVLARPEVLEPVMRQLELGFQELRGLSEALSGRLLWLEEGTYTARENLRFLTSASLQPLRAQMRTGEIATWSAGAKLPPGPGQTSSDFESLLLKPSNTASMASASASAASLLFLHPQLRLCERVADHTDGGLQGGAAERARGAGYVATGLLKRGELLVEAEGWAFGAGKKQ